MPKKSDGVIWNTLNYIDVHCLNKIYFIVNQQKARYFVHYSECLSNPLPFYATKMINPFLTQANYDEGLRL